MCSPSWTLLPPPSPYHPSGLSQCSSPKHPVSCIEPGLATRFIHDIIHVSMPFSQIFPPSPSPTESIRLFYTSVSLLLSRTQSYCYHLSKFHIYALDLCWNKSLVKTHYRFNWEWNVYKKSCELAIYTLQEGQKAFKSKKFRSFRDWKNRFESIKQFGSQHRVIFFLTLLIKKKNFLLGLCCQTWLVFSLFIWLLTIYQSLCF